MASCRLPLLRLFRVEKRLGDADDAGIANDRDERRQRGEMEGLLAAVVALTPVVQLRYKAQIAAQATGRIEFSGAQISLAVSALEGDSAVDDLGYGLLIALGALRLRPLFFLFAPFAFDLPLLYALGLSLSSSVSSRERSGRTVPVMSSTAARKSRPSMCITILIMSPPSAPHNLRGASGR